MRIKYGESLVSIITADLAIILADLADSLADLAESFADLADSSDTHADLAKAGKNIWTTRNRKVTKFIVRPEKIMYKIKVFVGKSSTMQTTLRKLCEEEGSTIMKGSSRTSVIGEISSNKVANKFSRNEITSSGKKNRTKVNFITGKQLLVVNNIMGKPRTPPIVNPNSNSARKGGKPSNADSMASSDTNNNGKHLTTPPENVEKKMKTNEEKTDEQIEDELLNPEASNSIPINMEIDESPTSGNKVGQHVSSKKPITWEINLGQVSENPEVKSSEYVELERRLTAERIAKAQAELREADLRREVATMQETLNAILTSNSYVASTFAEATNQVISVEQERITNPDEEDEALWALPMDSGVEQVMVIHFKGYPDKIFDNEEFSTLQKALSDAHQKAKSGIANFRIIIDDLALKQGVAVARCRNVGTIIWISHMIPRLNENLVCVKSKRIKLAPAFKIWASGADLTFDIIKEGVMDHEIDSSGWKLIKVREPNPRAKVQGVDALFLGDENLKRLVRSYETRQCLVQFRLGGPKARIQSLMGIDEPLDGSNGENKPNYKARNNHIVLFKTKVTSERSKSSRNRTGWIKPTTVSCNSSQPGLSRTSGKLRNIPKPRTGKAKYLELQSSLKANHVSNLLHLKFWNYLNKNLLKSNKTFKVSLPYSYVIARAQPYLTLLSPIQSIAYLTLIQLHSRSLILTQSHPTKLKPIRAGSIYIYSYDKYKLNIQRCSYNIDEQFELNLSRGNKHKSRYMRLVIRTKNSSIKGEGRRRKFENG